MKRNGRWIGHPVMALTMSDEQGFVIGVSGVVSTWQEYLKTPWWRFLSQSKKIADRYRCRFCGSKHRPEVHHRTYKHVGTLLEWVDLITLCHRCHSAFHEGVRYDNKTHTFVHLEPYIDTRSDEVKELCDKFGFCSCAAQKILDGEIGIEYFGEIPEKEETKP